MLFWLPRCFARLLAATAVLVTLAAAPAHARGPLAPSLQNLDYRGSERDVRTQLDLWRSSRAGQPLVVFVHGGGWHSGDKRHGRVLASVVVAGGYNFASVNYRLMPQVRLEEAASDIASAIAFLQKQAEAYKIDANRIIVVGHSAGAHLAALTVLDTRYLLQAGAVPTAIKGVILLDGIAYDMKLHGSLRPQSMNRFADPEAAGTNLSPIAFVGIGPNRPAFFIAYGDGLAETKPQSLKLAERLKKAGYGTTATHYPELVHTAFVREWNAPSAPLTRDAMSFIQKALGD